MRTLALLIGVTFTAAAPAAPVPVEAKAVELIVNGSFEEGPAVEAWQWIDEKSDKIKGWVVINGQIDYIGTHWKAAHGKRSLDLHGSPGFGGVKQTIKSFEFDSTGKTAQDMGWEKVTWDFKAEGAETEIRFETDEKVDANQGPALDNVSVKLFK